MRELGVALGQMYGQADLGWRDMATGSWARLESIRSIPWSGQNWIKIRIRTQSPMDSSIYTKLSGRGHSEGPPRHMCEHKLTWHVHPAEYENTQHGDGNPMSDHFRCLAPAAPAIQGKRGHANPAPKHRIGAVTCKGGLIP